MMRTARTAVSTVLMGVVALCVSAGAAFAAPGVSTQPASGVRPSAATLNGTVNPKGVRAIAV